MNRVARQPLTVAIRPGRRARASLFSVTLACATITSVASFTQFGCEAPPSARRDGIRAIHATDVGGYLEFIARDRHQRQTSKVGAGNLHSDETIFEENLKLETDGYVYHPNLLDITLGALFGLRQHEFFDDFGGRERTSGDDTDLYEFDFTGEFFKKKPYPGSVFARRYRAITARPFQSSIESTITNYGLVWQYASAKTPTFLRFNQTDVRLEPLSDLEDGGEQENTLLRFETDYKFNSSNVLSMAYEFRSLREDPFQLEYDSNEIKISHRLDFHDGFWHRLDSEVTYFDQKGTFEIERLRWREILRLQHSEELKSWYQFELIDRTQGNLAGVPPIEERSYAVTATGEHKLYDSLVSQLIGYVHVQEFAPDLRIDRYGVQLNLDYRKKNRWGYLKGNYRVSAQREDHEGGVQSIETLDERHTLRDPEPIVLSNSNIEVGTIFVTAEDRFTVYRLDRDYRVERVGDQVEIRRVPTGRIPDGGAVLVDYVFRLGGSFRLDTVNHELFVKQQCDNGIAPYYRLRQQNQSIDPKDAVGALVNEITGHTAGIEYRRGRIWLLAEYEDHDSTISPYNAVRLRADYTRRFKSGATGQLKARWSRIDHRAPNDRETRFFTLEGRYRHPISDHLNIESALLFRNENDSLTGKDEGVDFDLTLEWTIRQTEIRMTYDYGKYDDAFAENDFSTLFLRIRRRF